MIYFAKLKDLKTILMLDKNLDKFVDSYFYDLEGEEGIEINGIDLLRFLRDYSGHWIKVEEEHESLWFKETGSSILIYEDWFSETVRVQIPPTRRLSNK